MRSRSLHACASSVVFDSVTPWTVAAQAPLTLGFPRQEYWSGLPFPPPGESSRPRDRTQCIVSPALAGGCLPPLPPGKPVSCLDLRRYTFQTRLDSSTWSGVPRRPPHCCDCRVPAGRGWERKKGPCPAAPRVCLPVPPPPPRRRQRRALWTCLVPKHFPCSRSLQAQTSCPPVRPSVQHWSVWKSRPRVEVSRGPREGGFPPGVTKMLHEHGFPPGVTEMLRDLAWGLRTRKGGLLGQPEDSIAGRLLTTRGLCSREKAG